MSLYFTGKAEDAKLSGQTQADDQLQAIRDTSRADGQQTVTDQIYLNKI